MPHLSPMNWIMALTSFWFILLILSSLQWWNQSASFTSKSSSTTKSPNLWKWL